jgi:hypothetical protein
MDRVYTWPETVMDCHHECISQMFSHESDSVQLQEDTALLAPGSYPKGLDMATSTFDTDRRTAPIFAIELHLQAQDLQHEWRRCNMLANYIAEYVAYQFPEREWAENLISTVTNEFLEAVTHISPGNAAIVLRCMQYDSDLSIEIEHSLRSEATQAYMAFVQQLSNGHTDEIYFDLLTAADGPALNFNQFGMVMLVHDFNARIAAQREESTGRIGIRVSVPTNEISV